MIDSWTPSPGQVVLMEPQSEEACDCLTGLVLGAADGVTVQIALSPSCSDVHDHLRVLASFFAPDALYRVTGELHLTPEMDRVVDLEALAIERVQRRSTTRVRCRVPVSLGAFDDGDFSSVKGETIDLGPGGCRVATSRPFPRELDPTVTMRFPNGSWAIALTRILETRIATDHWEYRLVFADLTPEEASRIGRLAAIVSDLEAGATGG